MTGRPPKTSAQKALEGNRSKLGKSRIKADPKGRGRPSDPKALSPEARPFHAHVVGSLPDNLLSRADDGALEVYAEAWARYRKARRMVEKAGFLVSTEKGRPMQNPLLAIMARAEDVMIKVGAELGLSPVSRARMATFEPPPDDTLKVLLGDELASDGWSIPSSATN
jgi:P27 family predicted phage terminase small subunit